MIPVDLTYPGSSTAFDPARIINTRSESPANIPVPQTPKSVSFQVQDDISTTGHGRLFGASSSTDSDPANIFRPASPSSRVGEEVIISSPTSIIASDSTVKA